MPVIASERRKYIGYTSVAQMPMPTATAENMTVRPAVCTARIAAAS